MSTTKDNYVDFVFVIPGKEFSQEFLLAWSDTITYLVSQGITFRYSIYYSPIISDVRNSLLVSSLNPDNSSLRTNEVFSGTFFCKRVVFIDSDIIWSLEDLKKVLFTEHDFISGVYPLQDLSRVSVLKAPRQLMTVEELKEKSTIFETYAVGFGFVSCSFDMLNDMKYPWFSVETPKNSFDNFTGEDAYFCFKAKDFGYKILVNPNIRLGHVKSIKLVL